jgi:solute carrier family 25 phosphate transporter 23/24/25/41
VSKQDLNTFMKKIDKDGDGMIDFEEWRDFLLFLPRDVTLVNVFQYSQAMNLINPIGDMSPVTNVLVSRLRYLVAGGIAGAVSRTATAPLDRLKIYLQTSSGATGYKAAGSGISSWAATIRLAVNDIYSKGGIRNFFRGNGLNIIKIMPESATKFYAFESSKQFILNQKRASNGSHVTSSTLSMSDRFLAGGIAGLCSQTLIYPLEIVKTRLMSTPSAENSKKVGIFNVINKVYQQSGPRGFFRGLVPSLIGVFPYAAIDLSVFETLKLKYLNYTGRPSTANPGVGAILVCGMISGTTGAVAVYPLNLIRTRLQAQDTPSHPYRYTGTFDAIRQTYQRESIKGFYKGLTPTLVKVVPAVSISYVVYEHCKKNMHLS